MTTTATLSQPHLAGLHADLIAVRTEAERLAGLSDAQLTWRPEPGVWSVADCFEHLRKVDKAYSRKLTAAVPAAEPGSAPFKPNWFAGKFIGIVSPSSTFKLKAPKALKPQGTRASVGAEAMQRYLDQQAELIGFVHAADEKNINTGTFPSPLTSLLRFTVGEALTMLTRHEQRHLAQAQRLTERTDFPRA